MRKAFTLLELVFVIVVIGIISVTVLPRVNSSNLSERTIDLASKIKYTQHLAMIDDKFDSSNSSWVRNKWQLLFSTANNLEYSITHNNFNNGVQGVIRYAIDPSNIEENIEDMELDGIATVVLTGGCAGVTQISFDYLGRPFTGSLNAVTSAVERIMRARCIITVTDDTGDSQIIHIEPETGYTHIMP